MFITKKVVIGFQVMILLTSVVGPMIKHIFHITFEKETRVSQSEKQGSELFSE